MDWKWCRKAAVHLGSGGAVYVMILPDNRFFFWTYSNLQGSPHIVPRNPKNDREMRLKFQKIWCTDICQWKSSQVMVWWSFPVIKKQQQSWESGPFTKWRISSPENEWFRGVSLEGQPLQKVHTGVPKRKSKVCSHQFHVGRSSKFHLPVLMEKSKTLVVQSSIVLEVTVVTAPGPHFRAPWGSKSQQTRPKSQQQPIYRWVGLSCGGISVEIPASK